MVAFKVNQVHLAVTNDEGATLQVLKGVDCALSRGRLTALTGPSGGGKTSLLRLLNRLDVPNAGAVHYLGAELSEMDTRSLRRRVGLVSQQPHIFDGTARDNLLQGCSYLPDHPSKVSTGQLQKVCELCQFPVDLLDRPARRLSVGQQQRLALGRALLLEPETLLLDEPASALDRPTAEALGRSLRQLCSRGMTIILVSHDLEWVRTYADEVLFLASGELLVQQAVEAFFEQPGHGQAEAFIAGEMQKESADG